MCPSPLGKLLVDAGGAACVGVACAVGGGLHCRNFDLNIDLVWGVPSPFSSLVFPFFSPFFLSLPASLISFWLS